MTDQQSQQRINEAADQLTDALVQSYKTVAERGVSAQEGSAQVTEVFFNQTINNLRAQAEENRQATQQLADQQQRQAEAAQTLTKESVGAYMQFMDSMFSFWQGGHTDGRAGCQGDREGHQGRKELESNDERYLGAGVLRGSGLFYLP
jgi:light-regulated signal transduction histidine kinase (bacteriophytochrome)